MAPLAARALLPRLLPARCCSRAAPSSCRPEPLPPCPPCEPPPRPPCRALPPQRVRARRVWCCPPARGCRPPCAPALPACSLTCADISPPKPPAVITKVGEGCHSDRDLVAQRLLTAKEARRWAYLQEVACRQYRGRPPPARYRLHGERECIVATDGCEYHVATVDPDAKAAADKKASDQKCGPCREPPPPKCIELVPDNACQVKRKPFIDPCAHRPKTILAIDRSQSRPDGHHCGDPDDAAPRPAEPGKTTKTESCSSKKSNAGEGLTSRIMKTLNIGMSSGSSTAAKPADEKSSARGTGRCAERGAGRARRAGDRSWCESLQPPPAGPARCRPPSGMRLRRNKCRPTPGTRCLHSSAGKAPQQDLSAATAESQADADKLAAVLLERMKLHASARGRVRSPCAPLAPPPAPPPAPAAPPRPAAHVVVPLPPLARAVRVDVTLSPAPPPAGSCPVSPPAEGSCAQRSNQKKSSSSGPRCDEKSASWIKGLQKKIVGTCKKNDHSVEMSQGKRKGDCVPPCAPKPLPCAPPPGFTPPPPSPPIPACEPLKDKPKDDGKKKKPKLFSPISVLF